MNTAIIAFGSNLENPQQQILDAAQYIARLPEIHAFALSPLYRTTPVGYIDQPDFINAVAKIQTDILAEDLLIILQKIEKIFGRTRSFRNAPRTLDLDIIDYANQSIQTKTLELPHPRAHLRGFVMHPLANIDPNYTIGSYGTASELAQKLGHNGMEMLNISFKID